uniref:Uncharacterized protein n=1 Tax=Scleropages formosus TaxID=113540 RepID=A0A8C9RCA4_SCLFO
MGTDIDERDVGGFASPVSLTMKERKKKKRQQEGRAMATLDCELPSPDMFVYERWSTHADGDKTNSSDSMYFCGQHPACDDLCFLVCNLCNQVIKPQGFQTHCGSCGTDSQ